MSGEDHRGSSRDRRAGRDRGSESTAGRAVADATEDQPAIESGRYLYCIVRTDPDARSDAASALDVTGVDGESVSIVAYEDVGAVVHACDGLYDSADLDQIKRWLVRHQLVVDEAGTLGTPIPFQFDTILRGDDADVRAWLREEYDTLDQALSELASHWEYRVEVIETDPVDDETLLGRDERLRTLDEEIADASDGAAFLLEKRFEQRLKELRAARRESVQSDLRDRLEAVSREVHALERSPSASLSGESGSTEGGETLCRLTLLAHEDAEGSIGSVLDDVAANDGLEVRFTGPWPPYTFAPELGTQEGGTDAAGGRS